MCNKVQQNYTITTTVINFENSGFIIIIIFKEKTHNNNFYTAHSYVGLIGVILFIIQVNFDLFLLKIEIVCLC